MRAVVQRVAEASVEVDGRTTGRIGKGLLILLGVEERDTQADAEWLADKLVRMRIFSDAEGKMNLDVSQVSGGILVVSQFTLFASTKKGNRPSFIRSAHPDHARPLYEYFVSCLTSKGQIPVETGIFAAMMEVKLINDGPVTIIMDTAQKE